MPIDANETELRKIYPDMRFRVWFSMIDSCNVVQLYDKENGEPISKARYIGKELGVPPTVMREMIGESWKKYQEGQVSLQKEVIHAYQKLVVAEKIQLDTRMYDLCTFSASELWKTLSVKERDLIEVQLNYMKLYAATLDLRISRFVTPTRPKISSISWDGGSGKIRDIQYEGGVTPECVCIRPMDKSPGDHHSFSCPCYVPPMHSYVGD